MNQYQVICPIGEGAHGIVLKGRSTVNGETVALKKVALKKFTEDGLPVAVIREIKALQCVEHENIVHLIDVFPQGLSFVMVFDFMPSNLWEVLNTYRLNGSQVKCFTLMLLKGLRYLHQNHIMHRDLKPANLLISHQKILKIADFGLCRLFFDEDQNKKVQYSHQVATRWYRAPELLYGARFYTESVDIWAAGCIVAEMLKGQPLFPGENDIDQLFKVISSLGTPDEASWPGRSDLPDYNKITFQAMNGLPFDTLVSSDVPGATAFVNKFLLYDASKRITAKVALEDEFFKQQPPSCSVQALPPLPPPKHVHFEDFDSIYDDSIQGNNPSSSHVSSADISSFGSP